MADLTGSTIASSYDQLLAMPSGGGNGATLVALTDGNAGNTFALQVSTAGIKSTGTLEVGGITTMAGDLRLEDDAGGEYFGIGTPATVTTYTLTVPAAVGGSGQALRTSDGSGTLEWYTPETGDITGVTAGTGLSGGGTSGTVTLNVEASQTQITALGTIGTGVWQGTAVDGTYIDLEGTEVKSTGETGGTKFLREDGDGTCSWQAATATLTIDSTTIGSSTAGSVLFVNSSNQLSQDNAELFWDNTGNNLLVGKTSTDLDVDGVRIDSAGRIEVARTSTSTSLATNSGGNLSLANPSATDGNFSNIGGYNSNELVDSQINFIHTSHSSRTGEISFSTHSGTSLVEAMRIDSAGNVGIGTDSPSYPLVVEGSGGNTQLQIKAGSTSYSSLYFGDADLGYIGIIQYNHAANDMEFYTGNSAGTGYAKALTIDDQQRVGIGGTPTAGILHTIGTGNQTVKFECTDNNNVTLALDADRSAASTLANVQGQWNGTAVGEMKVLSGADDTNKDDGHLTFSTAAAGTLAEAMRIDSTGNVGIGTSTFRTGGNLQIKANTSESAYLDIDSYNDLNAGLRLYENDVFKWQLYNDGDASDVFKVDSASGTAITVDQSGNVGIGQDSPAERLSIKAAADTSEDVIKIRNSSNTERAAIGLDSSGWTNINFNGSGGGSITTTGNSSQLKLANDGNVGIGGTPETILHCIKAASGAVGPALVLDNATGSTLGNASEIAFLTDSGASYAGISNVRIKAINTNASNGAADLTLTTYDGSSESERMRITSAGKVGIGTPTPGGPLEVRSAVAGHVDSLFLTNGNGADNDSSGLVFTQASATHNYAGIRGIFTDVSAATEDAELAFYTSEAGTYAEKMRIDSAGNVGIGTAAPTNAKLVVNNSSTSSPVTSMELMGGSIADGGGTGIFLKASTSTTADRFGARINTIREAGGNGAASLVFSTDDSSSLNEALRIDSDGAFGIAGANYGTSGQVLTSGGSGAAPTWAAAGSSGVTTTTTSSSGGAASYAVDFNGDKFQKVIGDASLTDLTFTSSNRAAGRTVTLLVDVTTNSPLMNSVAAPSWIYFGEDLNSYVPSSGYFIVKLTSWGTTDAAVTADVINSVS